MKLTKTQIEAMNRVQLDIFKQFIAVCKQLGLRYYMVHGSLLGAVRLGGFFPFDDDIDVAMPRADYNQLLKKGQALLPAHLFLQSYQTEKAFPLAFAKIRNNNTAFIQPLFKHSAINQGIYIDIFPIDNYPNSTWKRIILSLWERIYHTRILADLPLKNYPGWKKIICKFSICFCPSWQKAVQNRAELYAHIPANGRVLLVGGKKKERGIKQAWFSTGILQNFEDIPVSCPTQYKEYLSCIYGDFSTYHPMKKHLNNDGTVTVNAEEFSTTHSYKEFLS